ncbi:MAG: undecaprenyl-diphosphate phosphatase [Firmicutes bacterium]|nr:undecaprenyl-diphosphate phosphatase [Bacillota bacterium]
MALWQAVVLGLVQGLTEFLPVSSSGHLVLFQQLLGVRGAGVAVDVALHVGTLAAVVWVYGRDLARVLRAFARSLLRTGRPEPGARLAWAVLAATVPTGIIGLAGENVFAGWFGSLRAVGAFWLVTGALLYWAGRRRAGRKGEADITLLDALVVGMFQGLAIAPGLSRSGATIAAALGRGLRPEDAARFSFLLSIPAVAGAAALELPELATSPQAPLPAMALGAAVAAVSGVWAIRYFLRILDRGRLSGFAYYVWALGAVVLGVSALG